jgi:hypothetical protein
VSICLPLLILEHLETKVEPDATNEVSDDHCNDDQSEDLENVEHHVLSYDPLISAAIAHK